MSIETMLSGASALAGTIAPDQKAELVAALLVQRALDIAINFEPNIIHELTTPYSNAKLRLFTHANHGTPVILVMEDQTEADARILCGYEGWQTVAVFFLTSGAMGFSNTPDEGIKPSEEAALILSKVAGIYAEANAAEANVRAA